MGIFRLVLALFVVMTHVAELRLIGGSAVFAFFVLSGYLMTHVTCEVYGHSPGGFVAFWTNRALRLLPGYYLVLALTVVAALVYGWPAMVAFKGTMFPPRDAAEWFETATMLYLTPTPILAESRLVPPTWALTLELVCYCLIALGISRTLNRTLGWIAGSLVFVTWAILVSDSPWTWAYGSIPAAFLPFAVGALLYHLRDRALPWMGTQTDRALRALGLGRVGIDRGALLIVVSLAAIVALTEIRRLVVPFSPTLSLLLLQAVIVPAALGVAGGLLWRPRRGGRWRSVDGWAGDFSYPMYLVHYAVAFLVLSAMTVNLGLPSPSPWLLFAMTVPVALVFCWGATLAVDRPVQRLRSVVRDRVGARRTPQVDAA